MPPPPGLLLWAAAACCGYGMTQSAEAQVQNAAEVEERRNCERLMEQQLKSSHLKDDEECRHRVQQVYCAKLASVTHSASFSSSCPLDMGALSSPNHPVAGHLPPLDVSETEYREVKHVSIAFLVLVFYSHLAGLVKRLVDDLWHPGHTFLLHVDRKAAPALVDDLRAWASVRSGMRTRSNVHVRSEVDVKRSGASLLAAELVGLRDLLSLSRDWKYFLVLSDSDQLIRIPAFLQHFFTLHSGFSFINTEVLGGKPRQVAVECPRRVHAVLMGGHEDGIPTVSGLSLCSGSQFVALFRPFAEVAVQAADFIRDGAFDALAVLDRRLNDTSITAVHEVLREVLFFASPDETFFHTLAVNSEFCSSHMRHGFHFHDTQGNVLDESIRQYTDFPTGSPPTLAEGHFKLLAEVRALQPMAFARKFDPSNASSMALLDSIGRALSTAAEPQWVEVEMGEAWAGALAPALLGADCAAEAGLSTVRQVVFPVRSVFDIVPAVYRLRLAVGATRCLDGSAAAAAAGPAAAATRGAAMVAGEVWLTEKYAVPVALGTAGGAALAVALRGAATAVSPLAWLRVGTGWDGESLHFEGSAAVVGAEASVASGLFVVLHWRPAAAARRLLITWTGPDDQRLQVEEPTAAWALLSHSRAPLPSAPAHGNWSVEVSQRLGRGRRVVGERRFFVFGTGRVVPAEVVGLLFSGARPVSDGCLPSGVCAA